MPASPRRLALTAALCFALGTCTTVVSTIVLAVRPPIGPFLSTTCFRCATWAPSGGKAIFTIFVCSSPTYEGILVPSPLRDEHGDFIPHDWNPPVEFVLSPSAFAYVDDFWSSATPQLTRAIEMHGWPCQAAYSVSDLILSGGKRVVSATTGLPISRLAHPRPFYSNTEVFDSIIPLQPIWRGAAINTLSFSAPWAILLLLRPSIRRALRLRRGLCPVCAYNLTGNTTSICPECGHARTNSL